MSRKRASEPYDPAVSLIRRDKLTEVVSREHDAVLVLQAEDGSTGDEGLLSVGDGGGCRRGAALHARVADGEGRVHVELLVRSEGLAPGCGVLHVEDVVLRGRWRVGRRERASALQATLIAEAATYVVHDGVRGGGSKGMESPAMPTIRASG